MPLVSLPKAHTALARVRVLPVLLVAVFAADCTEGVLVAPNGSRLDLSAAATVIASDGGTTAVSALLTEQDGAFAENGTTIAFLTSGGEVCAAGADGSLTNCTWATVAVAETSDGIAGVLVRGGSGTTMTVQARSGSITASKDISISSLVAPVGGKMVLDADPDTVAAGGSTRIIAFISNADGTPVPNSTRVLFSASSGALSRSITLTQDGFASSTFIARTAAGLDSIVVASGSVRDTVVVTVK